MHGYLEKCASTSSFDVCRDIMERVRSENEAHWPHGLHAKGFDGGLWLLKTASGDPTGFVGWQSRTDPDGRRVGYYSVGVLPEYRGQGIAKEALSRLIREKSATYDVVRAAIVPSNKPSTRLAEALGVEIVKNAALSPAAVRSIGALVGATAGGPGLDYVYHHDPKKSVGENFGGIWGDDGRRKEFLVNTVLGALGGTAGANNPAVASAFALGIPGKDLIINANRKTHQLDVPAINKALSTAAAPTEPAKPAVSPKVLAMLAGAGLLGTGALALAGLRASSAVRDMADNNTGGKIRVTLPTNSPGDAETQVEMPLGDPMALSNNLYSSLGRDTRRRLRAESRERKRLFMREQRKAKNLGIEIDDEGNIVSHPEEEAADMLKLNA